VLVLVLVLVLRVRIRVRIRISTTHKGTAGIQHPSWAPTRVVPTRMLPRTTNTTQQQPPQQPQPQPQPQPTTPTTPATTVTTPPPTTTTRSQRVGKCTRTLSRHHKATIRLNRRPKATTPVDIRTNSNIRLLPRICTPVKIATDTLRIVVKVLTMLMLGTLLMVVKEDTHTMVLVLPVFHR
jgi:hypothetical protein